MAKETSQLLRELSRLRDSELKAHLLIVKQEDLESLSQAECEIRCRRLQGRVQLASQLLDLIESSRDRLSKGDTPKAANNF